MQKDIRPIKHDEIQWIREMRNLVCENLSFPVQINELEQEKWFENMSLDPTKQYFSVFSGGNLVGCMWYDEWDRLNASCRVGIFIHPDYHGQGIGYSTLKEFTDYLFANFNLHRIWCFILETNKASQAIFKKVGFKKEGVQKEAVFRHGKYNDYVMFAKICPRKNQ